MADTLQDANARGDVEEKDAHSSAGDDSSSSSSGSSSSSSSSDSESDDDAGTDNVNGDASGVKDGAQVGGMGCRSGGGSTNASNALGPSLSAPRPHGMAASAKTMNVNSTRAAARFKASETESMMPLGTRKRDRRTIEEIQRDLRDKRKKPVGTLSARSSPPPPRGSPMRSPEAEAAVDSGAPMAVGGPLSQFGTAGRLPIKRKPVSAHDRLAMKLNGRKRTGAKKPAKLAASSGTVPPVLVMTSKPMIKPMAATTAAVTTENSSSSEHGGDTGGDGYSSSVSRSPQAAVSGKVVRAVLRAMLRYGDLTDVGLYPTAANFADEYKMPSFVDRASLQTVTSVSTDRLHALAHEVAHKAKQAVEARPPHDNIKIAEVEARSTHIIERLYENLKLRIAVQRALRAAGCASGNAQANAKGAYVLVAKQSDLSVLGANIRDLLNWTWAEKEYDWSQRKDAALLLGVYVHGFGGWEDILNDDLLHFHGQRALKGERLKKRAENLLKRLPPPDLDAGDPRIVQLASSLGPGGSNSSQSLGAQFSAIIQSGSIAGVTASAPAVSTSGCGRMARAAERFATRQQNGEKAASRRPVGSSNGSGMSNGQGLDSRRQHKTVIPKSTAQSNEVDCEPEDGEVGGAAPAYSTSPRHKRRSSSVDIQSQTSSRKRHRNDSTESSSKNEKPKKEHRRRDRHKPKTDSLSTAEVSRAALTGAPLPLLSVDACYKKWKPNKKLQDIRLVLKKMRIMAEWSRNQNDEIVVEKVFKYVSTIGEAIDRVVTQHQDKAELELPSREVDELCTSLWTYAAGFTPFTPLGFERLYDDMCADADALVAAKS
ncbi:unnamed protein product [Hyaloperonospora brassicae]|uniref:ATP-dependent helicase CHD1-2/hrp3 HTH domain-containing protein n=1 Tax=Hyaloperonospora brassicae TaxID=162125 RepID=A0AAV0T384_HYABA|nr:unnamed protein product [Hyaloperonospora brassicae]